MLPRRRERARPVELHEVYAEFKNLRFKLWRQSRRPRLSLSLLVLHYDTVLYLGKNKYVSEVYYS